MSKSRRAMWFALSVAVVFAVTGFLWRDERVQMLGIAALAALHAGFEWMFGPNKEDD